MEIKDLTAILVVAMVGCVLVAGFIPVVGESVSATITYENDGYFKVASTDDDFSFSWDYDDPTTYIINDNSLTFVNSYGLDISIVMSDKFFIRSDHSGVAVYFNGDGVGNVVADSTNKTLTVSRSGTTITASNGNTTKTITDSSIVYYMSESGDYVMKKSTTPAYMLEDSLIFARGYSTLPGPTYTPILMSGDIENGVTATAGNSAVTLSDIEVNYTVESDAIGVYKLTTVTMTGTMNEVNSTITYSYFVVPASVTAEKAIHADSNTASIVSMIPFILIMGIVLMFVGVVLVRRYV